MFSIFKTLKEEFDTGLDEAKLVEFNKNVRTANGEKIVEYTTEIHLIMQRHYTNKDILKKCTNTLKYIEEVIKVRDEINYIKIHGCINNTIITENFMTKWSFEDNMKKID